MLFIASPCRQKAFGPREVEERNVASLAPRFRADIACSVVNEEPTVAEQDEILPPGRVADEASEI